MEKMYKRFGSNAMMVLFAVLLGFAVMFIGTETASAMEGNGTKESPYEIATYADLKEFAKIVNGTHGSIAQNPAACAKLTADIKCDDEEWVPIGTQAEPYAGTFDGKGMVIEKLSNKGREEDVRQGLFGTASSDAIIQDVGLKDVYIKGKGLSGGIVGKNVGTIQNCYVTGAVSRSKLYYNEGQIGGVAGLNCGTIKNCYNTGDVSGTGDHSYSVGGVAGRNEGTIENCYNTGDVSGTGDTGNAVGGVTGSNAGTIKNCYSTGDVSGTGGAYYIGGVAGSNIEGTITNCYNAGSVSGSGNIVGGVAGRNSGTITNCYNTGDVSGTGDTSNGVGGVAGLIDGIIENCYNTGSVSGNENVGGVAGRNGVTIENCYNTGSVSGNENVGGVAGHNSGTITNCYYDQDLCSVTEAIGVAGGTVDKVEGLSTDQMTGTGALNNMVFAYGEGETPPWMEKANDANARYYTHLKGFNFDGEGQQMDPADISTYDWPARIDLMVATPVFSPESGVFNQEQSVTISCETKDAAIYYTTDGSAPTTSGNKYTEPVEITETTTIKAMAVKDGLANSEVAAATYTKMQGDGSAEDPYQITNYAELKAFAGIVNGAYPSIAQNPAACAILTADIVCTDKTWEPIGKWNDPYTGTFDGNSKTIEGLSNGECTSTFQGLFGEIGSAGTVKSVTLKNVSIQGKNNVGGVAGCNEGTITNCNNTGAVSGSGDFVGGVVGENYKGTITNCYNTGAVNGNDFVGGVAGINDGGTIENCYNTGAVTGNDYVGGVAGLNKESGTIENCYNTGGVSGTGNEVGGVAGYNNKGTVTNCYNTGGVTGNVYVGGVAGHNIEGTITNCYNTGDVSGSGDYVGGVAGFNWGTITNCYYDNELCKLDKSIGYPNGTPNNVKGLTTEEMTGTGALSNMVFKYGTGETPPWMGKANDANARYYPHLKGFNFDGEGQQMDPADISTYDWPPKTDALVVETPTFDHAPGEFGPQLSVAISCATDGATIYYTIDGTNPTVSSVKYTGPVEITDTTTIKAFAIKEGAVDSKVATATYTHIHKYGAWTKLNATQHQKVCLHNKAHVIKENHKWDSGKVTKKATEKKAGIKTFTCTVCKATRTETIPKLKPSAPKTSGTPAARIKAGKKNITIGWNKVEGAAGYDIFFSRCDHNKKKVVLKNVKTIKGNNVFKWKKSGLKKGTAYKAYVKAYVVQNGKKKYVSKSPLMHAYTGNGTKKYTNAKSVKLKNVKKGKLSLKKGKTFKIKAKVVKISKKKKLMPKGHAPALRYMTTNKKVATVSKKGKIKAKGKGTCSIYVYAHNGVSKTVKITVK